MILILLIINDAIFLEMMKLRNIYIWPNHNIIKCIVRKDFLVPNESSSVLEEEMRVEE